MIVAGYDHKTGANDIPQDIANDSSGIIEYRGEKIGVYKDTNGKIYAVKPYCSHLGCELTWNNLEKTWDCPCHGSRYSKEGNIITEPTRKPLETYPSSFFR